MIMSFHSLGAYVLAPGWSQQEAHHTFWLRKNMKFMNSWFNKSKCQTKDRSVSTLCVCKVTDTKSRWLCTNLPQKRAVCQSKISFNYHWKLCLWKVPRDRKTVEKYTHSHKPCDLPSNHSQYCQISPKSKRQMYKCANAGAATRVICVTTRILEPNVNMCQ